MSATGGSIESVSLDGRLFSVAADADANTKLGGFDNEHMSNGDGTGRLIKTRTGWKIDGLALSMDDDDGDQDFLQQLQNRKDYFPIVVTYASGNARRGTGAVTGEVLGSSQSATAPIVLEGPGELTLQ